MALSYGVNLQSLRIEGFHRSPSSQHFRRYAHALPSLTEFGIFLYSDTQNWPDTDFFPAVCDFLRPKAAQLVHLELRAPQEKLQQDALGFDGGKQCWGLFKSDSRSGAAKLFPKLESLSMTLPEGNKSFPLHCSKLIPKGVTRLSLSGYQLVGIPIKNVFKVVSIRSPSTYMTGSSDNHPSRCTVTSQGRSQLAPQSAPCLPDCKPRNTFDQGQHTRADGCRMHSHRASREVCY
jgi:hypothetical protein